MLMPGVACNPRHWHTFPLLVWAMWPRTVKDKYPHNATEDGLTAADNDTEKKQPEGCEKDPKSMEESEEKPTEGCKKDPKPVTPQPGAAQLWLGGLKTVEEREENKHNKGNTMK